MSAVEPWSACWKPKQEQLVVADVAAQDDNVLLAVHESPQLRRRRVPLRGRKSEEGVPATEGDLLEHLLGPAPDERTLLVPIIGSPGIGKSHLIRWLKAALPTDQDLVVRHIPREGTSLPRVVELLFEGVEGSDFDELREKLAEFRGEIDAIDAGGRLDQIATQLVLKMAARLQFDQVPWVHAVDVDPDVRTALSDAKVLPALLTDASVRASLVREGGAVHRIARDIVEGYSKEADGEDDALGFRVDDLDLGGVRNVGPLARRAVVQLRLPHISEAAAKVLTDALDQASAELVPTGEASLNDLLQQFRRLLAEQGQELVLLFEDIAIARGLQLDLIDALTTPGNRPGEPDLCVLRVGLAVTRTYWEEAPETLSTRAYAWGSEMFDMDLPAVEAAQRAPELVGRYLNAARIGKEELLNRRSRDLAAGVENACQECPLRQPCHAAFGATSHGHGLFPLTEPAVLSLARQTDPQLRPRMVLSEVVAPALAQWDAINEHRFPDRESWHDAIAEAVELGEVKELPSAQQEALEAETISDEDRRRARTILRAWTRPENTDEDLLAALGIGVDIEGGKRPDEPIRETKTTDEPEEPERPKKPPSAVDPDTGRIEDWGGGSVPLGTTLARNLRKTIWEVIQHGVRWPELGRSQQSILRALGISAVKTQQAPQAIRIENTAGGGSLGQSRAEPLLLLEPTAGNARLLAAFHRLSKNAATLDDMARIRTLTQQVEAEVSIRLGQAAADRVRVNDKLRLMTLAACPLADSKSLGKKPNWRAALQDLSEAPTESKHRTPDWLRLEVLAATEHTRQREDIEAIATRSQGGSGAATALDVSLIDENSLARDPEGTKKAPTESELADQREGLIGEAEKALAREAQSVDAYVRTITDHVGGKDQLPLEITIREVEEAMAAAENVHLLTPHESVEDLRALQLPDLTYAAGVVKSARAAVKSAQNGVTGDSLFEIGSIDVGALKELASYLDLAAYIIGQSSKTAATAIEQRSGHGESQQGDAVRSIASKLFDSCEVPR